MRDLLYKNLTSSARDKKIITSSEVSDKEGIHSVVRRHFAYIVKQQVQGAFVTNPQPYFFVLKETNTKEKREHFFCKIKGSLLAVSPVRSPRQGGGDTSNGVNKEKLLLISFVHSLNIELTASGKLSEPIG